MWTSSMVLSALSTATFPDSAWPTSGSRKPSRICSPRGCKAAPSAPFAHSWLYSPQFDRADSFIAYEGTDTDGPFISPLRYQRDNVTGNYTWHISEKESLGFKLNVGRNDFFSSGQIALDLVADGQLDRFGYVDPFDGGRVRLGTLGIYYRRDLASGDIFKVDGFLTRNSGRERSGVFPMRSPRHSKGRIRSRNSRRQPSGGIPGAGSHNRSSQQGGVGRPPIPNSHNYCSRSTQA